jgi:ribosomal protein L7Ae-like RNA K-turn-binding protein
MHQTILITLRTRQQEMQLPYEIIATKSELGIATVKRFFLGGNSSISTVEKIANILKCDMTIFAKKSAHELLEEQIERKAKKVVGRVMKTSALEAQQPNNRAYEQMLQKAKDSIRKMSKSQIWA